MNVNFVPGRSYLDEDLFIEFFAKIRISNTKNLFESIGNGSNKKYIFLKIYK